jgi:beta-glucosidase
LNSSITREVIPDISMNQRLQSLLEQMTPAEKVGQMRQVDAGIASVSQSLAEEIRTGRIGSVINQVDVKIVNELQRIAIEESRLKIPLLIGRDVIHGFKTVMPIPLGQAATWNPDLVTQCAIVAGKEAASTGVN